MCNQPSYASTAALAGTAAPSTQPARQQTQQPARVWEQQRHQCKDRRRQPRGLPTKPPTYKETNVLLVPNNATTNVLEELHNNPDFDPDDLGIRHHTIYPSGPVLLHCKKAEDVDRIRLKVLAMTNISVRNQRVRPLEIRVHSLAKNLTEDQLRKIFIDQLGGPFTAVRFVDYTNPQAANTHMAVATVPADVFERAKLKNSLYIRLSYCPIATKPHLSRCKQCGLLGHSQGKCSNPPMETNATPPPADHSTTCRDCEAFNSRMTAAGLGKKRLRPSNHAMGAVTCPTRRHYYRRALPVKPSSQPAAGGAALDQSSHG